MVSEIYRSVDTLYRIKLGTLCEIQKIGRVNIQLHDMLAKINANV